MIEEIKVGMVGEGSDEVTREKSAAHIGSGDVGVYATPQMVLLVERTSHDLLAKYLSPGQVSVGVEIELKHLAATPIGDSVRARCEVTEVDGNRIELHAEMWDSVELVGVADHQRVIIEVKRFLQRVEKKAASRRTF